VDDAHFLVEDEALDDLEQVNLEIANFESFELSLLKAAVETDVQEGEDHALN